MKSLYFYETGSQDQPPIFFLPGGGVSGWSWKPAVELLPERHCVVIDLPETGGSLDCGEFHIAQAAEQVLELADHAFPQSVFSLAGLSLGAQVALKILADAPHRINKALLSGALVRRLPGSWLAGWMGWLYMPFRNIPALIKANMRSLGVPLEYYEAFAEDTRKLSAAAFQRITTENMTFGMPPGLENAARPTLALVGEKELGAMLDSARDLRKTLPDCRAFRVRGESHNWPLSNPALFARILNAFLDDRPLPGELMDF